MSRKASGSSKRARSPEPSKDGDASQSMKRLKATVAPQPPAPTAREDLREEARREKERKRAEREDEFRIKYTRAFPNWTFHFDLDTMNPDVAALKDTLERRLRQMGAAVEDFFSRDITHLITLDAEGSEKENSTQPAASAMPSLLLSPIKLKGRATGDAPATASERIAKKALAFGIKVWTPTKLESVLDRCHAPAAYSTRAPARGPAAASRPLTRLLEEERTYGTTSERDPTQKRHGFTYFSKGTYFVLVEDMRQELATIAAAEYPIRKGRDGQEKPTWPVLYCHPLARGPFVPYDEREERRRERADRMDKEREQERAQRKARLREEERRRQAQAMAKQHDLRRSASMHNLHRRASLPDAGFALDGYIDLDAEFGEGDIPSANASGYLASGAYMAASGNSVGVTSTTGTTSAAGNTLRNLQLPPGLRGRVQQQVLTSRRVVSGAEGKEKMGPPPNIPEKPNMLRKSRSTNTLRLPKREEGVKPGYCESCRVKFEDFKQHINGRRHRKYAMDESNFHALDTILSRVRRRTRAEVEEEKREWAMRYTTTHSDFDDVDEDATMLPTVAASSDDDVRWNDWVDDGEEL
ncbi:hypothetical protein DAEQUDRAFT_679798 [Daedalea quercina L-15889]|uniref:DBF4-type domain-containing protein n=1 Tax=Daedalea quercina L-15889 TaxID=1314783 RepID=A0A165KYI0_9APHY|nr:hypothetical protein DAEQUDRAFT_679798 [Daedalea quercina L-15889]